VTVEEPVTLELSGIQLRMRVDRVDRVAHGAVAMIDYKTGRAPGLKQWFEARPRAPQLGLYTLAWRARSPATPIAAAAYAQLCVDDVCAIGIADGDAWPGLTPLGPRTPAGSWQGIEDAWRTSLSAIAHELATGVARVTPRNLGETCERCGRHALCRILTAVPPAEPDGG
jgi:hypothetical protein